MDHASPDASDDASPPLVVRPLDREADAELELVATRMRATLEEVLGEARGRALYDMDWLRDRVRFHLDPTRVAEVFLAEAEQILGHTIVRAEEDVALISTIYVAPPARRRGVATALIDRAEAWARDHALPTVATHTARDNDRLIALLLARGYRRTLETEEMVRLSRAL